MAEPKLPRGIDDMTVPFNVDAWEAYLNIIQHVARRAGVFRDLSRPVIGTMIKLGWLRLCEEPKWTPRRVGLAIWIPGRDQWIETCVMCDVVGQLAEWFALVDPEFKPEIKHG